MNKFVSLNESYARILHDQEPNFLRLYLNPHVAQTCFCLDRYVSTTWTQPRASAWPKQARDEDFQSFLANGLEEALGGAIKLARYVRQTNGRPPTGLVLDPADRLTGFASEELPGGRTVPFLPGLRVIGSNQLGLEPDTPGLEVASKSGLDAFEVTQLNPLVLVTGANHLLDKHAEFIRTLLRCHSPYVITCIDRESLTSLREGSGGILQEIVPDIVVFDESFVEHAVPFSAFTACKTLFDGWNRPGKATFHSTTFQPNTISTLHFMNCLRALDPDFDARYHEELQGLLTNVSRRSEAIRRYYSPALYRLIRATGFETTSVRASGSFVVVNDRSIFDAVGGVACSIRGHNPPTYLDELRKLPDDQATLEADLGRRLHDLTGLECFVPAVSGATAVENALKVALIAQFPKRHVLALKAGFGGKTLFALTGTANPSYKVNIEPLYADVHYVDPFSPNASAQIDAVLKEHDVAVVQVELIQSVGGVRRVPEDVIRHLDAGRKRWGYLLLVDEVQTGFYRTGPFVLSRTIDLVPDLLLLGKGTSDMLFPFALTLYCNSVRDMLQRQGSTLTQTIKSRYGYEQGYKTVLNVLGLAEEIDASRRVAEAGELFSRLLTEGLASCDIVREVRVFCLLVGIELDTSRRLHRWLRKRLSALYLLGMLRHEHFPVFGGFCQYEPNVLKITPPLNVSPEEIRQVCATIVDVLKRPLPNVIAESVGSLIRSSLFRKKNHEYGNDSAIALAER